MGGDLIRRITSRPQIVAQAILKAPRRPLPYFSVVTIKAKENEDRTYVLS